MSLRTYSRDNSPTDFLTHVALGQVPDHSINVKFGRNSDIDTGTPEDVWAGGGTYTGFNATSHESIQALSADANDVGTLRSSGTATGGSAVTLTDAGADFVTTDSVAVGDLLINDTLGGTWSYHGGNSNAGHCPSNGW